MPSTVPPDAQNRRPVTAAPGGAAPAPSEDRTALARQLSPVHGVKVDRSADVSELPVRMFMHCPACSFIAETNAAVFPQRLPRGRLPHSLQRETTTGDGSVVSTTRIATAAFHMSPFTGPIAGCPVGVLSGYCPGLRSCGQTGGILALGRYAYRQPRVDSSARHIEGGPIIRLGS